MFNKALSVEELNGYIHSIFLAEEMLLGVTVFGEVSGFKISGQHAYFTVKGENAAIPCNLFNYKRTYVPRDGDSVLLKGSPDFYVKTGRLSFNVTTVQPVGVGQLHVELEMLKKKLAVEGIFAEEHKKALPPFPKDVCVITSKTGAVIRDIYRTVRNVNKSINLHVYNVRVQGEGAEKEIASALQKVDGKYDVIIVARGGGSFEDLAPFNTELVARAIYACETPVVSAVGHETDYTISDLAADARAATPTAAAHLVAFNEEELKSDIFALLSKMAISLQDKFEEGKTSLSQTMRTLHLGAGRLLERNEAALRLRLGTLQTSGKFFLTKKENVLEKELMRYAACNPLTILSKGYMGVSKEGKRVISARELALGEEITIRAKDGIIQAEIKELNYEI